VARKGKKSPAADAASVTPPIAPQAAPFPDPADPHQLLAVGHVEGDSEFIHHSEAKEVSPRTAKACSVWYASPATLHPLVEARRSLIKSAKSQGWTVNRVNRVHAYFNRSEEAIYLVAAEDEDLEALPATGWPKKVQINLYELMRTHNQDLPQGKSILCQARYEPDARVGPSLVIMLKHELKVRWESTKPTTTGKGGSAKAESASPDEELGHDEDEDE
jgi:hypothetical protein